MPTGRPATNAIPSVLHKRFLFCECRFSPSIIAPIIENLLDPQLEQPRQAEGERQRRVMLARLDRIDRLARHADPAAELGLAPAAFGAKHSQSVVQPVSSP